MSEVDSLSPLEARNLLRRFGIRPKQRLGQNFMIDARAREKVLKAAALSGHETVLEIGAGLGALTSSLAARCERVIAIEIDIGLISVLEFMLQSVGNVEIVSGDILNVDLSTQLGGAPYVTVANIPYYITSAVIRRLMEADNRPERIVLTIQKEVAERIVAVPGKMSLLALSVQIFGRAEIKSRIPASAFYPQPKVDSAVLRVDGYATPLVEKPLIPVLFELARAGFGHKRKQIHNALTKNLGKPDDVVLRWLKASEIRPEQRAQELTIENWVRLAQAMIADTTA